MLAQSLDPLVALALSCLFMIYSLTTAYIDLPRSRARALQQEVSTRSVYSLVPYRMRAH